MTRQNNIALTIASLVAGPAFGQPAGTLPDIEVSVYATMPDDTMIPFDGPVLMSFDHATGTLYVGRSGPGVDALPIYRVPPGGGASAFFGEAVADPDSVFFDAGGVVSGVPGTIVVGGGIASNQGRLTRLDATTGAATLICGVNGPFANPGKIRLDSNGVFVMADDLGVGGGQLVRGNGCVLSAYVSIAGRTQNFALDRDDAAYVTDSNGQLLKFSSGGDPQGTIATDLGVFAPVVVSTGGPFGEAVYVATAFTGELRRMNLDGSSAEVIAAGFTRPIDLEFGPDGALYLSDLEAFRVYRISVVDDPCNPADLAPPFGVLDLADTDAFIAAFLSQDPAADLAPPTGIIDLADIDAFIAAFLGGCP